MDPIGISMQRSAVMYGAWIPGEQPCEGFQHSKDHSLVVYAMQQDHYTKMVGLLHGQVVAHASRAKSGDRQLTRASVSDAWDSADTQVNYRHLLRTCMHD